MNEKVNKVIDVVLKVISVLQVVAQALKAVFPAEQAAASQSQNQQQVISNFFKGDL